MPRFDCLKSDMNTIEATNVAELDDAELVAESLEGNRDAFRQIVERYQTLISSLAYCATGNINQSEDLAQETFVRAWQELEKLREPAKLRPWLCSITRFLVSTEFRRQGRQPAYAAESLEAVFDWASPEPLPSDHVIGEEEKAILWRSLERIPEIYRETLVLFYREQESIETVARNLGLTEDAVKQRLSRGRKMLQEQFLAFVTSALKQTAPGKAFTLGVIAALPLLATTAKGATAGAAATKGGTVAKVTGLLQTALKVIIPIGLFVSLGSWIGYIMGRDAAGQSQRQRNSVARFWGVLVACLVVFVLLPILLWVPLGSFFGSRENLHAAIRTGLDVLFVVMVAALALWAWQRRKCRLQETVTVVGTKKTFLIWSVALAVIATGAFLALGLSDSNWTIDRVSAAEARGIIRERGKNAQFFVFQYQNGSTQLWIKLVENGKLSKFIAPADSSTLALLAERQIKCPTYVQGRDFEIFGWQGKLLMGLCLLIMSAGAAVLLTLVVRNQSKTPMMATGTKIALVAAVALAAVIVSPFVVANHNKANSVLPNRDASHPLTPEQLQQAQQREFFEALERGDWSKITSLCPPGFSLADKLSGPLKARLTGMKLLSLDNPYVEAPYPGVFVPYEIQFKNGETRKSRLAVRNDNPEQKWYFDGGL